LAKQHEDFGEKIGGAKKDLWRDRGLYVTDLDAMNDREAEKFVKKDNIWKKPDYGTMLEDGVPLGVVYFIKKARDSLNAAPQYGQAYTNQEGHRGCHRQSERCEVPHSAGEAVSVRRNMGRNHHEPVPQSPMGLSSARQGSGRSTENP
jgi:hypothetical protein